MVHQDIHLDKLRLLVADRLVVEGRIPPRPALQRVKEIVNDLIERQLVFEDRTCRLDVVRTLIDASALLAERHDRTDILRRDHDLRADHRLLHIIDLRRRRKVGRVGQVDHCPVCLVDLVNDGRRSRHEIQVILSLEPLRDDIEVQQTKKSAAETEAQRLGCLRLELKSRVIELQLLERVPKIRIAGCICRVNAAVDHRLRFLIARQGLLAGARSLRDRIADARIADLLDAGCHITDLAR